MQTQTLSSLRSLPLPPRRPPLLVATKAKASAALLEVLAQACRTSASNLCKPNTNVNVVFFFSAAAAPQAAAAGRDGGGGAGGAA